MTKRTRRTHSPAFKAKVSWRRSALDNVRCAEQSVDLLLGRKRSGAALLPLGEGFMVCPSKLESI
jgi:hypothetical protein